MKSVAIMIPNCLFGGVNSQECTDIGVDTYSGLFAHTEAYEGFTSSSPTPILLSGLNCICESKVLRAELKIGKTLQKVPGFFGGG